MMAPIVRMYFSFFMWFITSLHSCGDAQKLGLLRNLVDAVGGISRFSSSLRPHQELDCMIQNA
jgi:hypothetical protein